MREMAQQALGALWDFALEAWSFLLLLLRSHGLPGWTLTSQAPSFSNLHQRSNASVSLEAKTPLTKHGEPSEEQGGAIAFSNSCTDVCK